MYPFYSSDIASAEEVITAKRIASSEPSAYSFDRLEYPDICIPNRGAAWTIYFKPQDSKEKTELKEAVSEYNAYLERLEEIDGFIDFFIRRNYCVSKEEIVAHWSEQIANVVFSKKAFIFKTDLRIVGDYLIDASQPVAYSITIDGTDLTLPIGKDSGSYPETVGDRKIIWNWVDNGHDFCYFLWDLLGGPYWENDDAEDDENAVTYSFDAYDQFRDDEPELQLVRIFTRLENIGYIKTLTIKPEEPDPRWNHFCKSDGTLDCAIVDMSFMKNKLTMEQINLLLWSKPEELKNKPFIVTNENNKQELSATPGTFGGHKKLKIYGRLDCPSARKHLAKGQYAKNRVFFLTEEIASNAGYRPCAKCMPTEYKKWKAEYEEAKFQQEYWAGYEQGFYQ